MLDKIGEKLLEQSVVAFVAIAIVLVFIRYMERKDSISANLRAEQLKQQEELFKKMHEEHIYAREQTKISVDHNTAALEANASATDRNSYEIGSLSKAIDNLVRSNGHSHK